MSKSDRRDGERAEIQTESERAGQNENNPPLNSESSASTQGIISSKQSWECWDENYEFIIMIYCS